MAVLSNPGGARLLAILLTLAFSGLGITEAQPTENDVSPATLLEQIRGARLDPQSAVAVENLSLNAGGALFHIRRGHIFPSDPIGERAVELVFLGDASFSLEPPDAIEAEQLELFTGAPKLDEKVTEAVIVVALDAAADSLTGRQTVNVGAADRDRAQRLFERWRERPERRLLGIETAVLRDALSDPAYQGFFAGWLRGERLGEILYLFEPDAREQVVLGRFVTLDASDKEKRKLARQLHRQQRRGRLIGLSVDDLGRWDTWLSASRSHDGSAIPGAQAFEPKHYLLDVTLAGSQLALRGRARIELVRVAPQGAKPGEIRGRMVKLEMHADLRVDRATLDGKELFVHQIAGEVLVVLPEAAAQRLELALEVEFSGRALERVKGKTYALVDTTNWYPHTGTVDLATYDVTIRWPKKLELMAAGQLIESGRSEGGMRFERRLLERPSFAFSFEIGKFRNLATRVGHVDVTLAVDELAASALDQESREQILATVADSLAYFEQVFGPYPLDRLTVLTAAREFSQSLVGFITLSTLSMLDTDWMTLALGLEDRRTIIAHEIAHQWWGHIVGWHGYRDQWISEAMANYSAVLYARHRLRDGLSQLIGPTAGWQEALTETTASGRAIESLGPLVLGERLDSSLSPKAYRAIVYQKGAVVLEMLSRSFGERAFLEILRRVVEAASFRQISTETFVSSIERITGRDLTGFARQFIYGTGLPEVYYEYRFAPVSDGRWRVRGQARQQSPYRYRYRVVRLAGGGLDVKRERLDQIEVEDSSFVVPFELEVFDAASGGVPGQTNGIVSGTLLIEGEGTEFDFEVEFEPRGLWLDRRQEVFGRFFNLSKYPKRTLYFRGIDEAAAGRYAAAEDLLRQALSAEIVVGADADSVAVSEIKAERRLFDAGIHLELARLYLDRGSWSEARRALDRSDALARDSIREQLDADLQILEARLALHEGKPERTFRLMRKLLGWRDTGPPTGRVDADTESLLLLAIAAKATGRRDQLDAVLAVARSRGVETALLAK